MMKTLTKHEIDAFFISSKVDSNARIDGPFQIKINPLLMGHILVWLFTNC